MGMASRLHTLFCMMPSLEVLSITGAECAGDHEFMALQHSPKLRFIRMSWAGVEGKVFEDPMGFRSLPNLKGVTYLNEHMEILENCIKFDAETMVEILEEYADDENEEGQMHVLAFWRYKVMVDDLNLSWCDKVTSHAADTLLGVWHSAMSAVPASHPAFTMQPVYEEVSGSDSDSQ